MANGSASAFQSPTPEERSFRELISAARAGSADAASVLIEQCRDYLLLIAGEDLGQHLNAKLGASDVVQQTLVSAWQNFQQFRGETQEELAGWLRQILKNDLLNAHRYFQTTQRRDARREHRLNDSRLIQPDLVDQGHTPGTDALIHEQEMQLERAMAQLPENYRQVIRLRNWQEMPFSDIGRQLGMSSEAARKIWSRAIERLADLIR